MGRFILFFIFSIFLFSCINEKPKKNPTIDGKFYDKEIKEGLTYCEVFSLTDTIYFNLDSIKKKCVQTGKLIRGCKDIDALGIDDEETLQRTGRLTRGMKDIDSLLQIHEVDVQTLFAGILVRDYFIHTDYGKARIEFYSDSLDSKDFINSYFLNYFETDSLFFFTTGNYELGYLCPDYLFILDRFTGKLLNLTHCSYEMEFATKNENIGKSIVVSWSDTLDMDSSEGSMLWIDSIQIETSLHNDGTIKWRLNFVKDKLLHDSM